MKKAVLKIFVIILVNLYSHITCCQSYYQISGRVKIVIGLSSILPSTSTILQIENSNKLVETDSTGSFRFENLPSGTYLIKIVGSDILPHSHPLSYGSREGTDSSDRGFQRFDRLKRACIFEVRNL